MASTTTADLIAHRRAFGADIAEVARLLQELLGPELTARIAGIGDEKIVDGWARGERVPTEPEAMRLREALRIAELLLQDEAPATIRAWFVGMNTMLSDRAPAVVLAEDPAAVLDAARAILAYG